MTKHNQLELAERVDAASAKARELKTELEAAQRRIADLMAEKDANGASSMARPSIEPRERKTARRLNGGSVTLKAGLAVSSAALLAWGALTLVQFVSSEPIAPLAEPTVAGAGPSAAKLALPPAGPTTSPATSPSSDDPATGGIDPNGETPPAGAQDLAAAQHQIAGLTAEVEASDQMIARLRDELHLARQAVEATRGTGSEGAAGDPASPGQESSLAAAVTTARVVELQKELEAARRQIGDLSAAASNAEAEVANLRNELAAREDLAIAAQGNGTAQPQEAETIGAIPVIEEVLAAAEIAPEPSTSEAAADRDTVSPDDLLLEPSRHFGRQVVVTGPVVWLLRRYWLQSDGGTRSLLIDVDGLQSEVRNRLKDAVEKIDYLAEAKARITGTIERQGSKAYRLAATELVLVE